MFKLSDGGQIHIDLKGTCFLQDNIPKEENERPLLFIVPGLTSDTDEYYIKNIAKVAHERGFDVAAINYRGLASCPLTTPKLYGMDSFKDALEPMEAYYEKYCKE